MAETLIGRAPTHPTLQFVADHKPGVLHTWTWEHLSGVCAADTGGKGTGGRQRPQAEWDCFISAPGKDRFYICDPDKNVFGSFYHVRVRVCALGRRLARWELNASVLSLQEPETERKQLTFADFAACAHKWRTRKVLLRAGLDCPQAVAHPRAQLPAGWHDEAPPSLRDKARALHAELDVLVDWAWLHKAVQEPCRFGGVLKSTLVACSPGGLQPARFMPFDTLLCQVQRDAMQPCFLCARGLTMLPFHTGPGAQQSGPGGPGAHICRHVPLPGGPPI